ncbi:putative gustatory receptor 2a [Anopheles marshallii]|uniref:putative gustatory receptor 2a n=1 Tax=Anopheles marshallii TaxID=1521116 RepID=UPI00237B7A7D|nr:putative gustatory receptor 2a [Anopheles marshallii]
MNLVLPLLPTARQLLCVAFAIFKLFGFIPFPFDCYKFELKPSSSRTTLMHLPLAQLLFYVIVHCTVMLKSADIFYTELQILNFNDILKYGSLMMAVFVIFICTIVQRNTHRRVWEMLRLIRGTTRKECVQRFTRQYLWKFYGYLLFSVSIEALELYSIRNSLPDFAYWLVTLNLSAFLRLRHLFHMFFINLLKIQLKQLQYGLVDVSGYMGHLHGQPKESDLYREMNERCVDRLLELKHVYGQLWELSDCINRTFGCSQICNFAGNFVQLSCDLYWCYMTAKGYGVGDYQDLTFITLLPTSCLIVLLLNSAEVCLRVTSSLQSILLEIPHGNDPTFRKIVYRFGLQIEQQKIRLTAYGLFEINYSLLRMFATGITTYMIIFITFSKELTPEEVSDG